MAVEVLNDSNRVVIDSSNNILPCIEIVVRPPFGFGGEPVSIGFVNSVPVDSSITSTGFWGNDSQYSQDGYVKYYFYYDPSSDSIVRAADPRTNLGSRYFNVLRDYFLNSGVYGSFVRQDETIDFLNVEGLTGTISQSVGKMIAVGLLLGIGLLSFKVGLSSLDKFLDDRFWRVRFENERSALEKEYKRLSRVYRDDPKGQKNLDRRFARRNTRLYEKYADYGVEKEDLIRTE